MSNLCSTHDFIAQQTFSVAEMEQFLRRATEYHICESCQTFFRTRIAEIINRGKAVNEQLQRNKR